MNTNIPNNPANSWKGKVFKNKAEIPNAPARIVFIDEGKVSNYAFSVHADENRWRDVPPIHHSEGTTFSFADGHSEYWKWKDPRTIKFARGEISGQSSVPDNQDLYRVQKAVWGKLGYTPNR